jgi:hypothetical protein
MRYLAIAILILAGGCTTAPEPATDPLGAAPTDLTVDVVIHCGPDAARPEVQRRSGRLVLFPDGSLHYGAAAFADTLPPKVRSVSRRDLAEVWSLIRHLGLADETEAIRPINIDLLPPASEGVTYVVTIRADGDRWVFVRESSEGETLDPASVQLIRRLAELAWASDIPPEQVTIMPRRYDLGPDPYERYRAP